MKALILFTIVLTSKLVFAVPPTSIKFEIKSEKQLGETCGPCFNPDTNYDCGKCANNLACQPGNPQLPDQPGSCVKEEDFKEPSECPGFCTFEYDPVCGTDGKTYSNKCDLESTACREDKPDLEIASQGPCDLAEKCTSFCTTEYAPVCGSNGKTYSNRCALKAAACTEGNPNLELASEGECGSAGKCPEGCSFEYAPVCGSDGKTYPNECALKSAVCKDGKPNLVVASKGECGDKGKCPEGCTFEYAPVCGSDGKTYSNECALKSAVCKDGKPNLVVASQGECSDKESIVLNPNGCCFSYGFGARAVPCCLKTITCEEHDKLVEENKVNPIAGGSFGKHKVCPKDAAEAHRLVSEKSSDKNFNFCDKCCHENADPKCAVLRIDCASCKKPETKCSNPGKSVPSPFDSCNICRCTDKGVIEGCTKILCLKEEPSVTPAKNPYEKLIYCVKDDPNICEEQTDGVLNSCKKIPQEKCRDVNGNEVDNCFGVCVYAEYCDANKTCKDIGNAPTGILYAKCDFAKGDKGKCQFADEIITDYERKITFD